MNSSGFTQNNKLKAPNCAYNNQNCSSELKECRRCHSLICGNHLEVHRQHCHNNSANKQLEAMKILTQHHQSMTAFTQGKSITTNSFSDNNMMVIEETSNIDKEEEDLFYRDNDIMTLLDHYNTETNPIEIFPCVLGTLYRQDDDTTQLQAELEFYTINRMTGAMPHHNEVFIPVNLGRHWVALHLRYNNSNSQIPVQIDYFDSLGYEINNAVIRAISAVFGGVNVNDLQKHLQTDGYNCGSWIIEFFRSIATPVQNQLCDCDIELVREEHDGILQNSNNRSPSYGSNSSPVRHHSQEMRKDYLSLIHCKQRLTFVDNKRVLSGDVGNMRLTEWARDYQESIVALKKLSKFSKGYDVIIDILNKIINELHSMSIVEIINDLELLAIILSPNSAEQLDLFQPPQKVLMRLTTLKITSPYSVGSDEYNEFIRQLKIQLDGLNEYSLNQIFLRTDLYDFGNENRRSNALGRIMSNQSFPQEEYCRALLEKMKRRAIRLSRFTIGHNTDRDGRLNNANEILKTVLQSRQVSNQMNKIINHPDFKDLFGRLDDFYQPKWVQSSNHSGTSIRSILNESYEATVAALHSPDQSMSGKRRFPGTIGGINQQQPFYGRSDVNSAIGAAWRGNKDPTAPIQTGSPQDIIRGLRSIIHPWRWCNLLANFRIEVKVGTQTETLTSDNRLYSRPRSTSTYQNYYQQANQYRQTSLLPSQRSLTDKINAVTPVKKAKRKPNRNNKNETAKIKKTHPQFNQCKKCKQLIMMKSHTNKRVLLCNKCTSTATSTTSTPSAPDGCICGGTLQLTGNKTKTMFGEMQQYRCNKCNRTISK